MKYCLKSRYRFRDGFKNIYRWWQDCRLQPEVGDRINLHHTSGKSDKVKIEKLPSNGLSPAGILISLSAAVGVVMIGLGIIWPLVPVYAVQLGAGGLQVGIIIASFNLARTLFNPLAGRLSDRWGRKPFIAAGLLLYALISVLYIMATRVEALILVRFLHGFTSVLVGPVAMALAADIAPPHRLGRYMGTLNMAVMLGLGAGPVLGGIIRDLFGMAAAFYTMGGLALITFVGVMAFLPGSDRSGTSVSKKPVSPLKSLLSHRIVQGIFLLRFFVAAGQGSVYAFLPLLALGMRLSSSQVGIILGANIFFNRPFAKSMRGSCRPYKSDTYDHYRDIYLRAGSSGDALCGWIYPGFGTQYFNGNRQRDCYAGRICHYRSAGQRDGHGVHHGDHGCGLEPGYDRIAHFIRHHYGHPGPAKYFPDRRFSDNYRHRPDFFFPERLWGYETGLLSGLIRQTTGQFP